MQKVQPASFADLSYREKKKQTRREKFLAQMNAILPWDKLLEPIERSYPKGRRGRPPVGVERMFRIYLMQQWYGLSDPAMEENLYDIEAMRRFAGVGLGSVPDETTICKFRHYLEKHSLTKELLEVSNRHLEEHGLILNEGTIVDASIIRAPSSTKNEEGKRDPEMRSVKKGNNWYFGMKAHIGTDTQGLVRKVEFTAASVHDSQLTEQLLEGETVAVYGDKAYVDGGKKNKYNKTGVKWRVSRKAKRGRKLSSREKMYNGVVNSVRARVEHAFGVVKNLWGYRKTRYRGLEKNGAQMFALFGLANFYMVRKKLLELKEESCA